MEAPPHYANRVPPSYDSLFGHLKAAKASSNDRRQFVVTTLSIIRVSVINVVVLALFLAVSISAIVVGAVFLDDCPAERYITKFLIVYGCFTFANGLMSIRQHFKRRRQRHEVDRGANGKPNPFDFLLSCFLIAWFIAGNVWIYRLYGGWSPVTSAANYCNPVLYYYTFWLVSAHYILLGAFLVVMFIGVLSIYCCTNV